MPGSAPAFNISHLKVRVLWIALCVLPLLGCASSRTTRVGILSQSKGSLSIYAIHDKGTQLLDTIRVTRLDDTCTPGLSERVNCPSSADEACKDEGCVHTGECICGVEKPEDTVGHIYALCDCPDEKVSGPLGDIEIIVTP